MAVYDRDYMRGGGGASALGLGGAPRIVWVFLGINIAVFVLQMMMGIGSTPLPGGERLPAGAFDWDLVKQGHVHLFITYQFVHGSFGHIIFNMLSLYFLGREVARLVGSLQFVLIYLLGGVASALMQLGVNAVINQSTLIVGASGSVSALLGAFAMLVPRLQISVLLFFIIPVRSTVLRIAWGWVILNVVLGLLTIAAAFLPVAWFAHVGGTLYGFLHGRMFREREPGASPFRRTNLPPYSRRKDNPNVIDAQFTDRKPDYNEVLDKINKEGMGSLTAEERRILEQASEALNKDKRH